MRNLAIFLITYLAMAPQLSAYPSFVSHGYKSCVTCHFNPQGNGPLNDYGRALFASEIASRNFANPKDTDEELGDKATFFKMRNLPAWLRPHLKARLMVLEENPGGPADKISLIPMQADLGTALLLDSKSQWVFVATGGFMPTPRALVKADPSQKPSQFISREVYLRWNPHKSWFVSAGLLDKVYGIRIADHTAYSREKTGNAMNDQTHGVAIQYLTKTWEATLHPFAGNLSQDEALRQKGASLMFEADILEKARLGVSVLSSRNAYIGWNRAALHNRIGYGEKNSFLVEAGAVQNKPKNSAQTQGFYTLLENMGFLSRGYHLLSQFEFYNQTMTSQSPDQFRWTLGLLMFPADNYEVRTTVVNSRIQSDTGVSEDQWMLQAQLHLSL